MRWPTLTSQSSLRIRIAEGNANQRQCKSNTPENKRQEEEAYGVRSTLLECEGASQQGSDEARTGTNGDVRRRSLRHVIGC